MCQISEMFENNSLPLIARCLRRGDSIDLQDYCGIVRAGQLAEKISPDGETWVTSRIRNEFDLLGLLPYPTTFVAIKETTIRLLPLALVRHVPTLERVVFREALGLQRDLLEQLTNAARFRRATR